MAISDEKRLELAHEIDTLLAKNLSYEETVAAIAAQGYDKNLAEDLVLVRLSAKAVHQPLLPKKSADSPNFDALHKGLEKPIPPLRLSIWEMLGGFGSAIVLLLMAFASVWYGVETDNVLAFVFALGCFVAAFLNASSNYRGMW